MTISTNYNPSSLLVQRNLNNASGAMNLALERMSTGFRVNRAADDAAGMYVATKMNSQIRGLLQAQKNTRDGLSFLQSASSGLNNMTSILQRLRDLSVQAASGFYGDAERKAMQAEVEQLRQQLFQVKNGTNYNGINIFGDPEIPIARSFSLRDSSGKITTYKTGSESRPNTPSPKPPTSLPEAAPDSPADEIIQPPEIKPDTTVSMTGEEMQLLKSYLESGGSYDDFSMAFKNNRHQELVSKKASIAKSAGTSSISASESGNINFTGNQTQVVTLDGKTYTITNKLSDSQQLTYSVDNGVLKLICSSFTIVGQADKQHNLDIVGASNNTRTGNLDDKVTCSLPGRPGLKNYVYGGAGNDEIIMYSLNSVAYGEDGDDLISFISTSAGPAYGTMNGGAGNDTLNASYFATNVLGGDGDDIINFNNTFSLNSSEGYYLNGEGGNDHFNITNALNLLVNGGSGINTIVDNGVNTTKVNVEGANAFAESFAAGETRNLLINGITYTVTNASGATDFIWKITDSTINFLTNNFTITGEKTKAHDVKLSGAAQTFYGGNLDDKIETVGYMAKIYAGDGNDIISGIGWQYAYGEGGDDTISGGGGNIGQSYAYGGDGNDTITSSGQTIRQVIYGGAGNDTFNIIGSAAAGASKTVYGEDGDDTFNVLSGNYVALFGGAGTNLLNKNNGVETKYSDMSNVADNMTTISFTALNQVKNILINGINYTVKNIKGLDNNIEKQLGYSYNDVTGEITFSGVAFEIRGDVNKAHNVRINGRDNIFYGGNLADRINCLTSDNIVYAGAGNDYIEHNGNVTNEIHGEEGDDEIVLNYRNDILVDGGEGDDKITIKSTANNVQGGNGNDHYIIDGADVTINDSVGSNIFEINGSNNNIVGGSGQDTFYVNGNENVVRGGGGDDYIVVDGDNCTIDGGPGNNLVVDKGTGNSTINVTPDPNAGTLFFNAIGQTQTITLNGRIYIIKNTTTEASPNASNQLQYNFNNLTGEVEFEGDNFTIESEDGFGHNLIIKGNNNVIKGGDQNDKIVVSSGSGNLVQGGKGNDSITINSVNNKVQGGDGDDRIIVNASQGNNLIDGESGNDSITVNAGASTNIKGGFGNDTIKLNGNGNSVDSGDGNDNLTAIGSNNTLQSSSGDNKFGVSGSNNIVIGGTGNESFTIDGDTNTVTAGVGNDTINIKGDKNNVSAISGTNNFTVNGSQNILQGGSDIDKFDIAGIGNTAKGGDGNDSFNIRASAKDSNIDGEGGTDNTMVNRGKDTTFANIKDVTPIDTSIRLQVGAGSDENSFIEFSFSLSFLDFNIDFSSSKDALKALEDIDGLLDLINKKNSEFGAVMNRLDSVLQSQIIQIENLTASRSTIMDADIAEESAIFVKNQILQQTSATLLSQSQSFHKSIILGLIT